MLTEPMVEIPTQIRDEIRTMRTDLASRIDKTNERLDRTNERLDRMVHEQIRQTTALTELAQGQRQLVDEVTGLNGRIDNVLTGAMETQVRLHDQALDEQRDRTARLEARVHMLETKAV